jgi:hypothetical protein
VRRVGRDGDEKAQDDENLLKDEAGTFAPLEVAHIIPHSLMAVWLVVLRFFSPSFIFLSYYEAT